MRDPNDIAYDEIPSNAEEMEAWERKFGQKSPVGGVEDRFESHESHCVRPKDAPEDEVMKAKVIEQLKTIYDPELPVDIYNLGLVYEIACWKNPKHQQSECQVTMTLTSATCSMSEVIVDLVRSIPTRMGGTLGCLEVNLVFDPPWDQSKMSEEAKLAMGML